ncbi:Pro-corazonin [Habropoda laboriosa]|uniref:Pro-corazonin n=1 Tax=Habropoda laboriosa TaxID=597456 RepID=A0A0L7RKC2_9HYME|nr:Pro-corazonin [Habropoda laboriosa]
MVNVHTLVLVILSLTVTTVMCQTFQYSHGWTNGKRSILEELVNSASKNAGQSDNVLVNCELQKIRLLLQGYPNQGNAHQFIRLPCVLLASPKRDSFETMTNDHYHRQPISIGNNY